MSAQTVKLEIMQAIEDLKDRRKVMIGYLNVKVREEDWHGMADGAMDLRDIDNEIFGLRRAWTIMEQI